MKHDERRNDLRTKTLWTVFDLNHDEPMVIGYIKEVSFNGFRIATNKHYTKGQTILLKIRIPEQYNIITIEIEAIIRHVSNLITPKPYENEIGVEILTQCEIRKNKLLSFFNEYEKQIALIFN